MEAAHASKEEPKGSVEQLDSASDTQPSIPSGAPAGMPRFLSRGQPSATAEGAAEDTPANQQGDLRSVILAPSRRRTNVSVAGADPVAARASHDASDANARDDLAEIELPSIGDVTGMGKDGGGLKGPKPAREAHRAPRVTEETAFADESLPADIGADGDFGRNAAVISAGQAMFRFSESAMQAVSVAATPVTFLRSARTTTTEIVTAARADALGADFMVRNTAQTQRVLAVGPIASSRIRAVAESSKAAIGSAVAQRRAEIVQSFATVRGAAKKDAATAKAQILAKHDETVATIAVANANARVSLEASRAAASVVLAAKETSQLAGIEPLYAEGDRKFRSAGRTVGDEAVALGNSRAQSWLSQRNGVSDILDGPIHDNRLEARADAAGKVADQYKQGLIDEATKQASEAQKGKPRDLKNVSDAARRAQQSLDTLLTQSQTGLDQSQSHALTAAEQINEGMTRAVDSALAATLAGLVAEQSTQVARVIQFGERQKLGVDRDADLAAGSLLDAISDISDTLTQALTAFAAGSRSTETPDLTSLGAMLGDAQRNFNEVVAGTLDRLEDGVAQSEQGLATGGSLSVDGVANLGQTAVRTATSAAAAAAQGTAGITHNALSTLSQLRVSQVTAAGHAAAGGLAGFTQINLGIANLFRTIGQNLETNFAQAALHLEAGLRGTLAEKLNPDIDKFADEAAAQVQPRWKTVAKVLLAVAVIVVVALVAGPAVIGFVGAAAGALGASAAAAGAIGTIVGGAIVGAAAGATIQIGNNLIDGARTLGGIFKGVGTAALVGAIGGALGGLGAVLGKGAAAFAASGNLGTFAGGTVGRFVIERGVSLLGDITGGVLGDIASGRPVTLEGVLIGVGIGLGVGLAASKLGSLGRIGESLERLQVSSFEAGAGLGKGLGTGIAGIAGIVSEQGTAGARSSVIEEAGSVQSRATNEPASSARSSVEEPTSTGHPAAQEPSASTLATPAVEESAPSLAPPVEEPTSSALPSQEPARPGAPAVEEPPASTPSVNEEPTSARPGTQEPAASPPPAVEEQISTPRSTTQEAEAPLGAAVDEKPASTTQPVAEEPAPAPRPVAEESTIPRPGTEEPGALPRSTAEETPSTTREEQALPANKSDRARIIRQDEDFSALVNKKGVPKSHLEDGAMVPANPDGDTTPLQHIIGSQPGKGNSPYTSFLTEEGGVAKAYGPNEVELDLARLQADIAAGKLPGVEVVPPAEIKALIKAEIEQIASGVDVEAGVAGGPAGIDDYVAGLNLSKGKSSSIARRLLAYYNTSRDSEYLIKGVIPADYIKGPMPSAGTTK